MARRSPSHPPEKADEATSEDAADDWHRRHAETKRHERGPDASIVRDAGDDVDEWRDRHARVPRS